MTREEAARILDAVIPPPDHHTVDLDHLRIAQAWAYVKETLTAEPRWIPTTERLPDVGVYVLVCTKQKSGQIIERIGVYSGTSYGWSTGGATRDVVAWMPLPKIYKGDEVEDGGNK